MAVVYQNTKERCSVFSDHVMADMVGTMSLLDILDPFILQVPANIFCKQFTTVVAVRFAGQQKLNGRLFGCQGREQGALVAMSIGGVSMTICDRADEIGFPAKGALLDRNCILAAFVVANMVGALDASKDHFRQWCFKYLFHLEYLQVDVSVGACGGRRCGKHHVVCQLARSGGGLAGGLRCRHGRVADVVDQIHGILGLEHTHFWMVGEFFELETVVVAADAD